GLIVALPLASLASRKGDEDPLSAEICAQGRDGNQQGASHVIDAETEGSRAGRQCRFPDSNGVVSYRHVRVERGVGKQGNLPVDQYGSAAVHQMKKQISRRVRVLMPQFLPPDIDLEHIPPSRKGEGVDSIDVFEGDIAEHVTLEPTGQGGAIN